MVIEFSPIHFVITFSGRDGMYMRHYICCLLIALAVSLCLSFTKCLLAEDAHAGGGSRVTVIDDDAPLRKQPHRLAPVSARVWQGTVLVVSSTADDQSWLQVRSQEGVGWIHRSLVRPLPGAAVPMDPHRAAPLVESGREYLASTRHLEVGRPEAVYERVREGYAVGVDARLRIPVWVQYRLTAEDLGGPGDRDASSFAEDDSLPGMARAQLADYRHSGYDRGHSAPAGDMKRSQRVMDESFLLSNIAPQVGRGFNRDIWRLLEEAIRDWAHARGELVIITGPIFDASRDGIVSYEVLGENEVAVPTAFYKIVFDEKESEALAFRIPNRALFGRQFHEFLVSIDEIEAETGLDFLSELPEAHQGELEGAPASNVWSVEERTRSLMARAATDVGVETIEFDQWGRVLGGVAALRNLVRKVRAADPTHVFLMAHGWNNSRDEACASYQSMLALMADVADRTPGLRPTTYRPFVIGVYWPSKAWDETSGRMRSSGADEDLTLSLLQVLDSEPAPELYRDDIMTFRRLLEKSVQEVTEEDRKQAWEILTRYATPPDVPDDESIFDAAQDADRISLRELNSGWSIGDMFRVFTFWQMKKRAGEVGGRGGRQLVLQLMEAAPQAEIHVGGHSFGAKLWLSALSGGRGSLPRNVDSLILIQAAVSSYAFADQVPGTRVSGGYRSVLHAVSGPIVVTYSSNDWPLSHAYPLGSRLARQTGELESAASRAPGKYTAMGAVGAVGANGTLVLGRDVDLSPSRGLWNVDGGSAIYGHSEFYEPPVARLLWGVIVAER